MKRRILSLVLVLLLIGSGISSYGMSFLRDEEKVEDIGEKVEIKEETIKKSNPNIIDVKIPKLKGLSDKKFENSLNKSIKNRILLEVENFERETKKREEESTLYINYEVKSKGNVLSLAIDEYKYLGKDANGKGTTSYYNIDLIDNKLLTLKDIFKEGTDYKKILDELIYKEISKRDDGLFQGEEGFSGIIGVEKFYIDSKGNLVIAFDEYEIGPKALGRPEFTIDLKEILDILKDRVILTPVIIEVEEDKNLKGEISIKYPKIIGFKDKSFEEKINKSIEEIVKNETKKYENLSKNTDSEEGVLYINYSVKNKSEIISFIIDSYIIYPGMANGEKERYYFNIDVEENKVIELKDLFKREIDYKAPLEEIIKEKIEENKEDYFLDEGFKSLLGKENFYIDEIENLIIQYPVGEIAPRSTGYSSFVIRIDEIKPLLKEKYSNRGIEDLEEIYINGEKVELETPVYISKEGKIMLPIKIIGEKLGFDVIFNKKDERITLKREGLKSTIDILENRYELNNRILVLDKGAENKEGHIYVPIEYFEEVLLGNISIYDGKINIKY